MKKVLFVALLLMVMMKILYKLIFALMLQKKIFLAPFVVDVKKEPLPVAKITTKH